MTFAATHLRAALPILLAFTLLHFVWQGAAIAALLELSRQFIRRTSANVRYAISLGALLLMAMCPLLTMVALYHAGAAAPRITNPSIPKISPDVLVVRYLPAASLSQQPSADAHPWQRAISEHSNQIVLVWLVGVGMLALRGLGGWLYLSRMSRSSRAPGELPQRLERIANQMQVKLLPQLCIVAGSASPFVYGAIRTVIVLPAGVIAGLSPDMLDTVLAHELAHIRRHDCLANLMQCAIETVLFYHPAVWWVSGQVRAERETCCDDMVIEALGDRLVYARALEGLERLKGQKLVLAASGGRLRNRICYILDRNLRGTNMEALAKSRGRIAAGGAAAILGIALLGGVRATGQQPGEQLPHQSLAAQWQPPAEGPGIIITLRDSARKPDPGQSPASALIHDSDLQHIVSDLQRAGAKTIMICDQTVNSDTHIRAFGNNIYVNSFGMGRPFVVRALGNPEELHAAVSHDNGTLDVLRRFDPAMVDVETGSRITLPAPPAGRAKAAYLMQIRIIRADVSAYGKDEETVISSPAVTTFAGSPASISITSESGEGNSLSLEPSPGEDHRVNLKGAFTVNQRDLHASYGDDDIVLKRGRYIRVMGVVSSTDIVLRKNVEQGKVVRNHGAYRAYYVEVKVE